LKIKFGITVAEYDALFLKQDKKCAACGFPPAGTRRPHIDHDHSTGKIRGILCHGCNVALGMLGDMAEKADKLAAYRRRFL
jgi:hypothetical protein